MAGITVSYGENERVDKRFIDWRGTFQKKQLAETQGVALQKWIDRQ